MVFKGIHFYNNEPPLNSQLKDWVDIDVSNIGFQNISLYYLQPQPSAQLDDFNNFFSNNEFYFYALAISETQKILKILKCPVYKFINSEYVDLYEAFPKFKFTFKSYVTAVNSTDDQIYTVTGDIIT